VIELVRVAADLQTLCEAESWRFCFIGGLAVQRWGDPRETVDVDLTVLTGFGGEEPFIQRLLQEYAGRVDHPAEFARENRVLLLRAPSGVGIDIALGALPFEASVVSRSSLFSFAGDRVSSNVFRRGPHRHESVLPLALAIGSMSRGSSFVRPESWTGPILTSKFARLRSSRKPRRSWASSRRGVRSSNEEKLRRRRSAGSSVWVATRTRIFLISRSASRGKPAAARRL